MNLDLIQQRLLLEQEKIDTLQYMLSSIKLRQFRAAMYFQMEYLRIAEEQKALGDDARLDCVRFKLLCAGLRA